MPKNFIMESAKPLSTPLSMHVKLRTGKCPKSNDEKEFMSKIRYQSIVGSLMCVMIATRPNIAFPMGVVSRFLPNSSNKHWEAIKRY